MRIIKIGRSPQNDVIINDEYVSGSHCRIIQDDRDGFVLIDTNSSNGTYVNGLQRRGEVRLNPSDIVKIGATGSPVPLCSSPCVFAFPFSINVNFGRLLYYSQNIKKAFVSLLIHIPFILYAQADIQFAEAVDLGLSVKWATCNLGASRPEQIGDLFSWGETVTKTEFVQENYKFTDGKNGTIDIGNNISGTEYDAARTIWNGAWRMPTFAEALELCEQCTWTQERRNGVIGYKVIGPNGNSIFLPANEEKPDGSIEGVYWTGTLAQGFGRSGSAFWFLEDGQRIFGFRKIEGHMIRPVMTNTDYSETLPEEWQNDKYIELIKHIQTEEYDLAFADAFTLAQTYDEKGQIVLASMYLWGVGTNRNYEAAQKVLVTASEWGSERAEYMLGAFGSLEKRGKRCSLLEAEEEWIWIHTLTMHFGNK